MGSEATDDDGRGAPRLNEKHRAAASRGEQPDDLAANGVAAIDQMKRKVTRKGLGIRGMLVYKQLSISLRRVFFDDYTDASVLSHINRTDFLRANGFDVLEIRPRFLPLTLKSRLPVLPWLIRAHLASPIKPLAMQMLIRAGVSHSRRLETGAA
jgi:hypothetical protein